MINLGVKKVHCSDISDKLLRIGNNKGFINEFSAQNAESLKFLDNSFDYVLCKEAFHHFPRPFIALHEMFRVSQKGVVLIEPRDDLIDKSFFYIISKLIKLIYKKTFLLIILKK